MKKIAIFDMIIMVFRSLVRGLSIAWQAFSGLFGISESGTTPQPLPVFNRRAHLNVSQTLSVFNGRAGLNLPYCCAVPVPRHCDTSNTPRHCEPPKAAKQSIQNVAPLFKTEALKYFPGKNVSAKTFQNIFVAQKTENIFSGIFMKNVLTKTFQKILSAKKFQKNISAQKRFSDIFQENILKAKSFYAEKKYESYFSKRLSEQNTFAAQIVICKSGL